MLGISVTSTNCRGKGPVVRGVGFSMVTKRLVNLVNPGKTKGDAAVGAVLKLLRRGGKAIGFGRKIGCSCVPRHPVFCSRLAL